MIPTNTHEELMKAEFDLQRSTVSLIRELGKGNEKSRLHAVTLQALFATLREVQALIEMHPDTAKKAAPVATKKKAK